MAKRPKSKRKGNAGRPAERLPHIPEVQAALDKLLKKKPSQAPVIQFGVGLTNWFRRR